MSECQSVADIMSVGGQFFLIKLGSEDWGCGVQLPAKHKVWRSQHQDC